MKWFPVLLDMIRHRNPTTYLFLDDWNRKCYHQYTNDTTHTTNDFTKSCLGNIVTHTLK